MKEFLPNYLPEFKAWLKVLGYRNRSIEQYELHAKELLAFIQDHIQDQPQPFSTIAFQKYIQYTQHRPNQRRAGGLSGITINMKLRVVKLFLEYLNLMKNINLVIAIPQLDIEENQRLALSKKQIQSIYQVIKKEPNAWEGELIMCLYYACGLRRSEGLKVQLKDILLNRKLLYVAKGKNGKTRYVPLGIAQVKTLKNYIYLQRPKSKSNYLLLKQSGKPMGAFAITTRLQRWVEKAKIKQPVSLHVLRHSIATHLLENGMSLLSVSQFLGHNSLVSTQRYTHVKAIK